MTPVKFVVKLLYIRICGERAQQMVFVVVDIQALALGGQFRRVRDGVEQLDHPAPVLGLDGGNKVPDLGALPLEFLAFLSGEIFTYILGAVYIAHEVISEGVFEPPVPIGGKGAGLWKGQIGVAVGGGTVDIAPVGAVAGFFVRVMPFKGS